MVNAAHNDIRDRIQFQKPSMGDRVLVHRPRPCGWGDDLFNRFTIECTATGRKIYVDGPVGYFGWRTDPQVSQTVVEKVIHCIKECDSGDIPIQINSIWMYRKVMASLGADGDLDDTTPALQAPMESKMAHEEWRRLNPDRARRADLFASLWRETQYEIIRGIAYDDQRFGRATPDIPAIAKHWCRRGSYRPISTEGTVSAAAARLVAELNNPTTDHEEYDDGDGGWQLGALVAVDP